MITNRMAKQIYFDLSGNDTTLVVGSGRSGTSWLANICNYRNDFRYLFEPLNPAVDGVAKKVSGWALLPGDQAAYLHEILRGKVSGSWVDSRNKKLISRRRLIKEIRLNLMLGWVVQMYPNTRIVMLVRNPINVASSRLYLSRLNDGSRWEWKPSLGDILSETNVQSILNDDEYRALKSQVGAGVVMETIADWCLNNLAVWRLISKSCVELFYYEDLVANPEPEVERLLKFIGVPYDDSVNNEIQRSSETSRSQTVENTRTKISSVGEYSDGQLMLSSDQRSEMRHLFSMFDIEQLYKDDWSPANAR